MMTVMDYFLIIIAITILTNYFFITIVMMILTINF